MVSLENELIYIHQEKIQREARLRQALKQSGTINAPFVDRASSMLGDTLIRVGTRLKERSYTRLTADEATVPAFLIML